MHAIEDSILPRFLFQGRLLASQHRYSGEIEIKPNNAGGVANEQY